MGVYTLVRRFASGITLEPMIVLLTTALWLERGGEVNTNLMIDKVCRRELQLGDEICSALDSPENDAYQSLVQQEVNRFLITFQWLGSAPALVYSLFAGALSDGGLGRKPLLLFPAFGRVLSSVFELVNYAFFDSLPLEFFYLSQIYYYFGGDSVYYLGFYSFGASITSLTERATLLARFDGTEQLGNLVGTLLAPLVLYSLGHYGIYGLKLLFSLAAFFYLVLIVREPMETAGRGLNVSWESSSSSKLGPLRRAAAYLSAYVLSPFLEMLRATFRRRPRSLRALILVHLAVYGKYWFMLEEKGLVYHYKNKVFEGFGTTEISLFRTYEKILGIISLWVVMPIVGLKMNVHEAILITFINFTVALGK